MKRLLILATFQVFIPAAFCQHGNKDAANAGPRTGSYTILSYGHNNAPTRLGYFTLSASTYAYYDMGKKLIGRGTYTYSVTDKALTWTSGPFKDSNSGGNFEIDRAGKTHKIRLNTTTIGSNSTDSN